MSIDVSLTQTMTLDVTGDDITHFAGIFLALAEAKSKTGFVKTADLTPEQWEIVDAMAAVFDQE